MLFVPSVLQNRNLKLIFADLIADLADEFSAEPTLSDEKTLKALSYMACRSAIKTGENLTRAQAQNLLSVLDMTPSGYTCPHGRPTRVEIPLSEINKFFKR